MVYYLGMSYKLFFNKFLINYKLFRPRTPINLFSKTLVTINTKYVKCRLIPKLAYYKPHKSITTLTFVNKTTSINKILTNKKYPFGPEHYFNIIFLFFCNKLVILF